MSGKKTASDDTDEMEIPLVTKEELEMLGLESMTPPVVEPKKEETEEEPEEEIAKKKKKPEEEEPCEFEVKSLKNGGVFFGIPNFSEFSHVIMSPNGILAVPKDRDQWEVPYPIPPKKKVKKPEDEEEDDTETAPPAHTPAAAPQGGPAFTDEQKKNLIAKWQAELDADEPAGSKTAPPTGGQEEFASDDPDQFGKLLLKEARGLTGKA